MRPEPSLAITFPQIAQTDATGIVTSLHDIPYGDVWPCPEIMRRKREIEAAGFMWDVVESLPIHERIKKGDEALTFCSRTTANPWPILPQKA
jgi:mannonate dehydratase